MAHCYRRVGRSLENRSGLLRATRGFSLVEMLVVVSIVMILIALVLPSLASVKEGAKRGLCTAHMKEIYQVQRSFKGNSEVGSLLSHPGPYGWVGYTESFGAGAILMCPSDIRDGGTPFGSPSGSSVIKFLPSPPSSTVFNSLESSSQVHAFREREAYKLPSSVAVNISQPGYYDNAGSHTPSSIAAGTRVDCYFLHYDPPGNQRATTSGSVSVGGRILGLIVRDAELNQSDTSLGLPEVDYPTGQGSRGFENNAEQITLEDDMKTLTIHRFHSTFPGEQVRILTAPGGTASYGMNNQVPARTWPRQEQLLLIDYNKSVVDVDFLEDNNDDFDEWLAPRHFGKVNAMYASGGIDILTEEQLDPQLAMWKEDPRDGIDWNQ